MWKKVAAILAVCLLVFGPGATLFVTVLLVDPAVQSLCLPGGPVTVGSIPDSLTATAADGTTVTLNKTQLSRAATIVTVGGQTPGVGTQGVTIALMAALTESGLRMLANTSAYPRSANYPNDGDGSDHDSLGLFQMRPSTGWGSVAQLMDPSYQARAFFGGAAGPNHGSPRGLLDIPGWQQMTDGEAAQTVEVSAFPGRYADEQPVAEAILAALARPATTDTGLGTGSTPPVPETSQVVFPLPAGTWTETSPFGPRVDPITGQPGFHPGVDLAAPAGTPILAATDGRVIVAGMIAGTGTIEILATVDGKPLSTTYLHMDAIGIGVTVGELVSAGQRIGAVGSTGHATGPHLHFEVHPGGPSTPPMDPMPWLAEHGADGSAPGTVTAAGSGSGSGCSTAN